MTNAFILVCRSEGYWMIHDDRESAEKQLAEFRAFGITDAKITPIKPFPKKELTRKKKQ